MVNLRLRRRVHRYESLIRRSDPVTAWPTFPTTRKRISLKWKRIWSSLYPKVTNFPLNIEDKRQVVITVHGRDLGEIPLDMMKKVMKDDGYNDVD